MCTIWEFFDFWVFTDLHKLATIRSDAKKWWVDVLLSVTNDGLTKTKNFRFIRFVENFSILPPIYVKIWRKNWKILKISEKSKKVVFAKPSFKTLKNTSSHNFLASERILAGL